MDIKSVTPPERRPHACWGSCGKVVDGHRAWERHVATSHIMEPPEGLYNGCTDNCTGLTLGPPKPIADRSLENALFGED